MNTSTIIADGLISFSEAVLSAVRNSNHFGTAAYFTRLATPEGCKGDRPGSIPSFLEPTVTDHVNFKNFLP